MTRAAPITLCLYTSALGHFGRYDCYQRTVTNLLSQMPREAWGGMIAHIKVRPNEEERARAKEMERWLGDQGFQVIVTEGDWSHFAQTHQSQYIADVHRITSLVTTPYLLHGEDDWGYACYQHDLPYWLHHATTMLEQAPSLVQVRIARFTNEAQRIRGLLQRHGIDARVLESPDPAAKSFRHSDLSMNPSLFRTRDLRAAIRLLAAAPALPQHIEHGTAITLKLLSGDPHPFACLNPTMIRVGHLGVKTAAEEDNLDQPLLAT